MARYGRLRRRVATWLGGLRTRVRHAIRRDGRPETHTRTLAQATRGEVLHLAWPIVLAMLGETAMGLVDTWFVGGLGPRALGGVATGVVLMYLAYAVIFGGMRGVEIRTAHAVGRGVPEESVRYALAGVTVALGAGVSVGWMGAHAAPLLRALRVDTSLLEPAQEFLAARTLGAPAAFVVSALVQYRQGMGDARTPMRAGLAANVVNAGLAWTLIHGHLGMPALGVRGAGYATSTAETLESVVLLIQLSRTVRTMERPANGWRRAVIQAAGRVAAVGVPTALQFGAETLAFTVFTVLLGGMGAQQVAAHQIAMAAIRTSFLPGIAVAEAASVLVGRALGQGRLAEADRVTRAALVIAMTFMAACGVVFAVAGAYIVRGFSSDAGVVRIGVHLLYLAAGFQLMDASNIVLRGALRGARDVRVVAVVGTVVVWTCVPGAAWLLGRHLGLGAVGGWMGFLAETTVGSAVFWWRWQYGAWRLHYSVSRVPERSDTAGERDGTEGSAVLSSG